ncbi:hypothetical protein WJX73_000837 [Symbiochloris irregularis]|uniref:30S ribosomal protein 3, chloroplastic n=1 Tax=Symbiochloris irregularis TaxID=706552 RepID=A0AAW1Q2Z2_9CHLO
MQTTHSLQCPLGRVRAPVRAPLSPSAPPKARRASGTASRRRVAVRPAQAVADFEQAGASATPAQSQPFDQAFCTNFLWLNETIGVCVDQLYSQGQRSPLTEYFIWPKRDAWDELKSCLDNKTWITEADKNDLLNTTTNVFEFWQSEDPKPTLDQAREKFPDSVFIGA